MEAALEHHDLLFDVRRSIRYHNRRRAFFDRFNLLSSAVSVIFGSATILAVLSATGTKEHAIWAAAIVTILSTVNLVVGTARMARLHHDLARRFIDLEKAIVTKNDCTPEDVRGFAARRLEIEADEPPPLVVLDAICYNEVARSMGYEKDRFLKIRWYQRLLAQFIDVQDHIITA